MRRFLPLNQEARHHRIALNSGASSWHGNCLWSRDDQPAFDHMPRTPKFPISLDMTRQKNVTENRYWLHRQIDCRQSAKV